MVLKRIYRKSKNRYEYALVSKQNQRKVLQYFGTKKPSQKRVSDAEQRVQFFKNRGSKMKTRIKAHTRKIKRGRRTRVKAHMRNYRDTPVSFKPTGRGGLTRQKQSEVNVILSELGSAKIELDAADDRGDTEAIESLGDYIGRMEDRLESEYGIGDEDIPESSVDKSRRIETESEESLKRLRDLVRSQKIGRV